MSKVLTAEDIFAAQDLTEDLVAVPEWGGDVRLKQLSAKATIEMTKEIEDPANKGLGMFLVLVHMALKEDGSKAFTVDDIEKLKTKNFNILNRLQMAALKLNRSGAASGVALKKDLSEAVIEGSPTDSPKS